jgi:mono/diheme cytochrome c family protein
MSFKFQKKTGFMLVAIIAFVLAACASPTVAPTSVPAATEKPAAVVESTAQPAAAEPTAAPVSADLVSFTSDVMPILQNSCLKCHGGDKTEKGFSVASYDSLMAGSSGGAVIKASDPAASKLYTLIEAGKMPKRGGKLPDDQIQLIKDWIAQGALNN